MICCLGRISSIRFLLGAYWYVAPYRGKLLNYFLANICFTFLNPYFEILFKPSDYGDYTP